MSTAVHKRLIVNADDFGFSPGISAGILRGHREGIVTSTTLTANMPDAESAVALLADAPQLGVGVHLNACQGPPLSPAGRERLAGPDGTMDALATAVIRRCVLNRPMVDAIATEFEAQIQRALALGLRPTHLDSHRHVHGWPAVFKRVTALARQYNIPFIRRPREHLPGAGWPTAPARQRRARRLLNILEPWRRRAGRGLTVTTGTWGIAHTGLIDAAWLVRAIAAAPAGVTEIMVHPGDGEDLDASVTRLVESRRAELSAVCDPAVTDALAGANVGLTHYGRLERN